MLKITDKAKCTGCFACKNACPKNCIDLKQDCEGFLYPEVRESECIKCGKCVSVCPVTDERDEMKFDPVAYAAYSKDDALRRSSSSGGIFGELSKAIIEDGGVVFGAAFDESFDVKHISAETEEELERLKGSKYVQSSIGDCYTQVRRYLEDRREVLFSGTPCQAEGLLSYLGKEYENLYVADFICHGVPSPAIWDDYKRKLRKKGGAAIKSINFREKSDGWKGYKLCVEYENDKKVRIPSHKNAYSKAFLKNWSLRPSCYDCPFKGKQKRSDITLADCWGVENFCAEMYEKSGVSAVVLNSEKAKELFGRIKGDIVFKEIDKNFIRKYNSSIEKSAKMPQKRADFMKAFSEKGFWAAYRGYIYEGVLKESVNNVRRFAKTLLKRR